MISFRKGITVLWISAEPRYRSLNVVTATGGPLTHVRGSETGGFTGPQPSDQRGFARLSPWLEPSDYAFGNLSRGGGAAQIGGEFGGSGDVLDGSHQALGSGTFA